MDKIRCSADMRWKMSRWAGGLCHHDSGLEGRLRPVCPAVRASASCRERDLSQGCGEAWLLVPSLQWAQGGQRFRPSGGAVLGPWVAALVPHLTAGRGGNRASVLKLGLSLLLSASLVMDPSLAGGGAWGRRAFGHSAGQCPVAFPGRTGHPGPERAGVKSF